MKFLCLVALTFVAVCAAKKYTSDAGIDFDKLVADKEAFQKVLHCFTEKADCDPQAASMRVEAPDIISTACAECTDQQKHNVNVFLKAMKQDSFKPEYEAILKKYDSEDKYLQLLLAAVEKY